MPWHERRGFTEKAGEGGEGVPQGGKASAGVSGSESHPHKSRRSRDAFRKHLQFMLKE